MTAPWKVIKDRLVAEGDMTERDVTRIPKPRVCRSCGRDVIAAITDLGFEVAVEPTPTTALGELRTLAEGGATYALLPWGEMVRRSQHRIAWATPDTEPTHAQHDCGRSPPEIHPNHRPRAQSRTNFDGRPPF